MMNSVRPQLPRPITVGASCPPLRCVLNSASLFVVYYQILRCTSPLPSKCAVDPNDSAIGRAPARTAVRVPTVPIIKRYIAQREGFYPSQPEVISVDDETDCPMVHILPS